MLSFDLARCRGVRPALSGASTRAPAGADGGEHARGEGERGGGRGRHYIPLCSSVVMTGTWLVQAAEEEQQGLECRTTKAGPCVPARGSRTVSECAYVRSCPGKASLRSQQSIWFPPCTTGETEAQRPYLPHQEPCVSLPSPSRAPAEPIQVAKSALLRAQPTGE